jgi:hypothetical protein
MLRNYYLGWVLLLLVPSVSIAAPVSCTSHWTTDSDTGDDVLRGYVQYTPTSRTEKCKSIRFIQIARVEVSPGNDLQWQSGESDRNLMRTPKNIPGIVPGFYVDHIAFACTRGKSCSPYFRDSWPNANESQDGSNELGKVAKASLVDYPSGWDSFQTMTLESCAQCVDTGSFLGCAHWGADWPSGGRTLFPITYSSAPSATFEKALEIFHAFYTAIP